MIIQVDAINYFFIGFIAIVMTLFTLLFFLLALKMRNVADRYRLKYGYDHDIEGKEFSKDPDRAKKRYEYFKRRTFTD